MYSAVNILFLTSLALSSWVILCYFKQIENAGEEDFDVDIGLKSSLVNETEAVPCSSDYDVYLNFVCICTCIFALAKVVSITEEYIVAKMSLEKSELKDKKLPAKGEKDSLENSLKIEDIIEQHEQLLLQLEDLKKYNSELVSRMRDLEQSNQLLQGKGLNDCESFGQHQNIFISNQHFHMSSKDYLNGNLAFIWSKYLTKRNGVTPQSESATFEPKSDSRDVDSISLNQLIGEHHGEHHDSSPVIVSTEDLQKMQGIN